MKRKILYLIILIIIIILFSKNKIIEASFIPVSTHTVIIDAGHGLPDGGAVSKDGTSEECINLEISLELQKLLEASGCNVILTRSDENGIYDLNSKNKKKSDLLNRTALANNSNSDILISIHLNKINNPSCNGWQTFYQKSNDNSKKLAIYIQENLNHSIEKNNKRTVLPLTNKYLMDNVKIPTVTVECGFLSNIQELEDLKSPEYREKLAWGIYEGIIDYFSNTML